MSTPAPSRAIIDLEAYANNLAAARQLIGDEPRMVAVVKADAYGHGITRVAEKAVACGVSMLAVATVAEGVGLREAGITAPILVMTQPGRDALPPVVEHGLTLMVSDIPTTERLGELADRMNKVVSIHCKIDTGMGRQGFAVETAADDLQYLTRISPVDIEGIATHFPTADEPDDAFTYGQIKTFRQLLRQLDKQGIPYESAHAANSAAIVNYPGSTFDMVRVGLLSYGVWPTRGPATAGLLTPVLRWETRVTQVRELEPGASIGYGRTYTTPARMKVALLPVGYADGYRHALSNRADVLIRGKRCPVRGSVCMDQLVIDVSKLDDIEVDDVAVVIGGDGDEQITAEELARHAGTIPYEILAGMGPRVPREYV